MIFVRMAALAVFAAACAVPSVAQAIATTSAEAILGKAYTGPTVATPRDEAGKPLLTGFWKLLHEPGKPDGNLGKDQPGFTLPYTAAVLSV